MSDIPSTMTENIPELRMSSQSLSNMWRAESSSNSFWTSQLVYVLHRPDFIHFASASLSPCLKRSSWMKFRSSWSWPCKGIAWRARQITELTSSARAVFANAYWHASCSLSSATTWSPVRLCASCEHANLWLTDCSCLQNLAIACFQSEYPTSANASACRLLATLSVIRCRKLASTHGCIEHRWPGQSVALFGVYEVKGWPVSFARSSWSNLWQNLHGCVLQLRHLRPKWNPPTMTLAFPSLNCYNCCIYDVVVQSLKYML